MVALLKNGIILAGREYIILKGVFIRVTYSCGPASPTVTVYQQETSCSAHRLVFSICPNPSKVGPKTSKRMLQQHIDEPTSKGEQAKIKSFLLQCPFVYIGCHQVAWPQIRVGLPTSTDSVKKTPHRHVQLLKFWLIADVVKLTTKISGHTYPAGMGLALVGGSTPNKPVPDSIMLIKKIKQFDEDKRLCGKVCGSSLNLPFRLL